MPAKPLRPLTQSESITELWKLVRQLSQRTAGSFDPNEDPVIIGGSGATAGAGSTPDDVSAGAAGSVIIGPGANGGYDGTTVTEQNVIAVGPGAYAFKNGCISVGWTSSAGNTEPTGSSLTAHAIAVGTAAHADNGYSIAHGYAAHAAHDHSTALGPNSATSANNQIKLGQENGDFIEACQYDSIYGSILVMKSPNGTRYALQVSNAGALSAIASPV